MLSLPWGWRFSPPPRKCCTKKKKQFFFCMRLNCIFLNLILLGLSLYFRLHTYMQFWVTFESFCLLEFVLLSLKFEFIYKKTQKVVAQYQSPFVGSRFAGSHQLIRTKTLGFHTILSSVLHIFAKTLLILLLSHLVTLKFHAKWDIERYSFVVYIHVKYNRLDKNCH